MGKCVVCGKKGLFLRVNDFGRCKTCEEEFQKEKLLKKEEQRRLEKTYLERQENDTLFPIALHPYVITDIETTGLDYNICAIIEISAIKVLNGEIIDKYTSLIHSERTLSPQIVELTGITTDMIRSCNRSLNTVIAEYREFVGSYPLVGHNICKFDIQFIDKAYMEVFHEHIDNKCVDTFELSRQYVKNSKNFKLQTLAEFFNINVSGAHRAMDDCMTTYELYKNICEIAKKKQEEKEASVNPETEDGKVIQMTKKIFENTEHSYFRYRRTRQYLQGECIGRLFQIKTTGRIKNYIVFESRFEADILDKISLRTAPASSAECGTMRFFFENEQEFMSLSGCIVDVYKKQKNEVDKNIELERNFDNTGFIQIEGYEPHYEKWVKDYLKDIELIEI